MVREGRGARMRNEGDGVFGPELKKGNNPLWVRNNETDQDFRRSETWRTPGEGGGGAEL